jgi:hypothetical protein
MEREKAAENYVNSLFNKVNIGKESEDFLKKKE